MAAFRKQPNVDGVVADPSDPAKFKVVIGGLPVTCDVTNIFGYINAYPDEDADKIVNRFIRSITESRSRSINPGNIICVIRKREYIDSVLRDGLDVLHEPLGADLMVLYMADQPDSMSPISSTDLPGKDLTEVRKMALNNVRQWLPKVVSDDELGSGILYYVEGNTMLSTSLILLDEFWKSIAGRFPGDVLIALPRKDQLFIFDDGNDVARTRVRQLIDATIREDFNLLSPTLYARRNGKIVFAPD